MTPQTREDWIKLWAGQALASLLSKGPHLESTHEMAWVAATDLAGCFDWPPEQKTQCEHISKTVFWTIDGIASFVCNDCDMRVRT